MTSIIDTYLGSERADKLVACIVQDICEGFENPQSSDVEEMFASILDEKIGGNAGFQVLQAADEDTVGELLARIVVELDWQSRQGSDYAAMMSQFADFLAGWILEQNDVSDEDETEEEAGYEE